MTSLDEPQEENPKKDRWGVGSWHTPEEIEKLQGVCVRIVSHTMSNSSSKGLSEDFLIFIVKTSLRKGQLKRETLENLF